ncbi:uncharacterized protein LOC143570221 isoform X2 [Bidens hawaiensis]|uniref:uncharacterized protein LOC143570221 isoform X2 n=1 Tax=Bidens hawaiensis TaxID=980011 RepID=UPI00404A7006
MVFSGEKRQPSDEQQMDRLKTLHNFDLPCLKWGNQKVLRCMKVDSKGDVAGGADRKNSPETGLVIGTRRRDESERGFRSTDYNNINNNNINNKFSSSEKMKSVAGAGDGEIEATREKLMFDFQTEVGKMKDAILRGKFSGESPPSPAATTVMTSASPPEKPWNLRTRRAACKVNNNINNNNNNIVNGNCDDRKESFSPARIECNNNNNKIVGGGDGGGGGGGGGDVIAGKAKFSVSLTRRELEEDFTAMTGRRLPRKPKKRPRYIQKQLDTLFPGLWLSEITVDLYRVPDDTDTGKR